MDITYNDAKAILCDAKNKDFYPEILEIAPNIEVLFQMMVDGIDAAINTNKLLEGTERLQGGDITRLTKIAISLPYYMLTEQYADMNDFTSAYVAICTNYFTMYFPNNPILRTLNIVTKLFSLEGNYTKLLVASQAITAKMEKLLDVSDSTETGISRAFISTMMNEHIDKI